MTATPAQRLQVPLHEYQTEIDRFRDFDRHRDGKNKHSPRDVAWFLMSDSEFVAKQSHLAGHQETTTEWSRIAAESVVYYLLGDWKSIERHEGGVVDASRWFRQQPADTWVMYLEPGLCWGAFGGHWDLVDELLSFPKPDIQPDDDGRVARDYYAGLASWWRDPASLDWINEVKGVRGAGSKGYHLLCDAVAAIAAADRTALERSFDQYMKLFLKRRAHEEQFPVAATFLWYVARRRGLTPELPEETAKYIFTPLEAT